MVEDTEEKRLSERARQIQNLRNQLEHLWPPHRLTEEEKGQVIVSVRSIVSAPPATLRQLLERFIDVCNTVAYANSRGVLHRDLKPKNIGLGKFGETMILDWGLAKILERPDSKWLVGTEQGIETVVEERIRLAPGDNLNKTVDGDLKGTLPYMSPEQARGDVRRLTFASDIYSLGAILYDILAGRKAFEFKKHPTRYEGTAKSWYSRLLQKSTIFGHVVDIEASNAEVCARIGRGDFAPPREVNPQVPRALEEVCLKAMALDRERRYRTAKELADDVERWLNDEPVLAWLGREPLLLRPGGGSGSAGS